MQKRAILAITLSLLVLFSWQMLIRKTYHIDTQEVNSNINLKEPLSSSIPDSELPDKEEISVNQKQESILLGQFEASKLKLDFVNPGGKIAKLFLKDFNLNTQIKNCLYSKYFENKLYTFKKSYDGLELSANENGHLIVQNVNFNSAEYYSNIEIIYKNTSNTNWTFSDKIILNTIENNTVHAEESRLFEVVFFNSEIKRKNPMSIKDKTVYVEKFNKLGFRDRYACIILQPNFAKNDKPENIDYAGYIERSGNYAEIGVDLGAIDVPANSQVMYRFNVYYGPQDVSLLKQGNLGFEKIVNYGSFDFISTALLSVMNFFHKISRNWGVALILLSIFTFLSLYPLTLKQMRSMKEMQELQPQIEALRKNNKDNPQKLNKETMELYRKHKVNPLGGCLPMILQIPIFFGLYQALSRSIVLKGSHFLWIKDLGEPDRLFILPGAIPVIGNEINLLPILMAIGMFVQQKFSSATQYSTPQLKDQQKMMTIIFPIMFGFIFYHFPSGLALYWFTNTLLTTISQWKMTKARALAVK